ncbi:MAG: LysR family transcriptional regulator [Parasporobacterium sp.]|nr:LysR family transcriptional regulator [Parasporobacterium sp.]
MDLQKLKAFATVARHRSFTKASIELFISQPALSKKISDFEKELGTALLIRDNRTVELTEAGKLLYSEAAVLLKFGEDLERKVRQLGENPDQKLNIGVTGIEYGRLMKTLFGFHNRHPEIELSIHKHTAAEIRNLILGGMIDIGYQTRFEVENEQYVESIPFDRDSLSLVVSKFHRLANEKEADINAIKDERYVGIQPTTDHIPFSRMINMLIENGYNPQGVLITPNVDELVLNVACGLAVGHLFAKTENVYGGLLSFIKTKDYSMDIQIDMVWNRNNHNRARQMLIDFVKEENAALGLA